MGLPTTESERSSTLLRITGYGGQVSEVPFRDWLWIDTKLGEEYGELEMVAAALKLIVVRLVDRGLLSVEEVLSLVGKGYGEWKVEVAG